MVQAPMLIDYINRFLKLSCLAPCARLSNCFNNVFDGGVSICLTILHCIIYAFHYIMNFAFDYFHPPSLVRMQKRLLTTTTTTHLRTAEQATPEWSTDYEVRFGLCTIDLPSLTAAC